MSATVNRISPAVDGSGEVDWPALLQQALTLPGQMGTTYCRFYQYSLQNQILLWSQGVTEPCAPFGVWKKLGRIPVKGGGRYVLHPRPFRKTDEETGEERIIVCRFRLRRTVFPYSNTVGPDVEWPELPEWDWERALSALDIEQVPFQAIDGNTQGYSFDRKVAVSPVAAYPMKTAFHELAHVMLGHTTAGATAEGEVLCRGVREFQAEAVAYGGSRNRADGVGAGGVARLHPGLARQRGGHRPPYPRGVYHGGQDPHCGPVGSGR
jgi:hypothetical protein